MRSASADDDRALHPRERLQPGERIDHRCRLRRLAGRNLESREARHHALVPRLALRRVGDVARHHARQERGEARHALDVGLEPLDVIRMHLGARRERRRLAETAPQRQPVQPIDRTRDAARLHQPARREQQLLAGRERLPRHAREQHLEPRHPRRAREGRGVRTQGVGAGELADLDPPHPQGSFAPGRQQQCEQDGMQLARAVDALEMIGDRDVARGSSCCSADVAHRASRRRFRTTPPRGS